jgi:hypothetical protein
MSRARPVNTWRSFDWACRDIAKNIFLCNIPAERHRNIIQKFFFALHLFVLKRELERVACSAAAADDRDFVDRVRIRQDRGHKRVARLVVGGDLLLFFIEHMRAALGAEHHLLDRADEIVLRDRAAILARSQDCALVHE